MLSAEKLSSPGRSSCSALRANSFGHLDQIESYAPGHQVRFGSLNYVVDIRGDLIFTGFDTAVAAPDYPDDHDLNLSSGHIQEIAPITALALEPEQAATRLATAPHA